MEARRDGARVDDDDGARTRWDALAPPTARRRLRRTKIVVLALASVVLVTVGTAYVGYWFGGNDDPMALLRQVMGDERPATSQLTGRSSYLNNCASCHGPAGEGGTLSIKGPAFTSGGPLSGLTFEQRVAKIARGKPLRGMPAWKFRISEAEIARVAAYTQVLSGETPDPSVPEKELR
jgi:mono/diheme cytochrome c family protein